MVLAVVEQELLATAVTHQVLQVALVVLAVVLVAVAVLPTQAVQEYFTFSTRR